MPGGCWVAGYNGDPIPASKTVTLPPPAPALPPTTFTVTVRIRPSTYHWSFGDGTSIETHSLGKPYPALSDINHTYEFSLLAFPNGFRRTPVEPYRMDTPGRRLSPNPCPSARQVLRPTRFG